MGSDLGASPHDALDALAAGIYAKKVNWVLDADIRDFFGQLDHDWLMRFFEHRIADRRVLRLIQKWLAAGVIENGKWSQTEQRDRARSIGVAAAGQRLPALRLRPVGHRWRSRNAQGDVIIVRYADDYIVGFRAGERRCSGSLRIFATGSRSSAWSCRPRRRG